MDDVIDHALLLGSTQPDFFQVDAPDIDSEELEEAEPKTSVIDLDACEVPSHAERARGLQQLRGL